MKKVSNKREIQILQNTLNWYLDKLPPTLDKKIPELAPLLQNIQKSISINDITVAVTNLSELYKIANRLGLVPKVTFPGPGKAFKELSETVMGPSVPEQIGGNILKEVLRVNQTNYSVLGLVLQDNRGNLYLYDTVSRRITGQLAKKVSPTLQKLPAPKGPKQAYRTPEGSPREGQYQSARPIRKPQEKIMGSTQIYASPDLPLEFG